MATSSRIVLPFALWPEGPPSLSVSSLFINFASEDLITGTSDGFLVCWKIVPDVHKVNARTRQTEGCVDGDDLSFRSCRD